ncbi:MAG: F0F1 ATP synthase subunit A [Firmicutes bacterium]|nr:F0F1 ATP synthase subunit A [Bacillota bacterium]
MTWHLGPYTIDGALVIYTWIAIVLTAVIVSWMAKGATAGVPGIGQSLLESVFQFIADLAKVTFDPEKEPFLYELLITLFLFLLISNFEGMIPSLHSPTANLNLTAALAIAVFFLIQWYGVRYHGFRYFKHFAKPFIPLLPINLVEELSKPLTLAFRLFGNILVGEIFMEMIARFKLLFYVLGGFVAAFIWWGFTAFVNVVQAFIFMVLTMAYVGKAMAEE